MKILEQRADDRTFERLLPDYLINQLSQTERTEMARLLAVSTGRRQLVTSLQRDAQGWQTDRTELEQRVPPLHPANAVGLVRQWRRRDRQQGRFLKLASIGSAVLVVLSLIMMVWVASRPNISTVYTITASSEQIDNPIPPIENDGGPPPDEVTPATIIPATTVAAASPTATTTLTTTAKLSWPVVGKINTYFGQPLSYDKSTGIDIEAKQGTHVNAAASGMVVQTGWESGRGFSVTVQHDDNLFTFYNHLLEKPTVTKGQVVKRGEQIGLVGSSGNSTGPHLGFEVRVGSLDSPPVDPLKYLPPPGK